MTLDICLVSGADEIRSRSYINHTIYSQLHHLDYRLECGLSEGISNKFFYKTSIMLRVLPRYEWIVWLDDDVYITDFASDSIRNLVEAADSAGKFMVVAEGPLEPNGFWSHVNTGVLALKNCPKSFDLLRSMTTANLTAAKVWWDDERDGTFTGGDQDILWWWIAERGLRDRVDIVDHRLLNSRGHYYNGSLTDAFAMHFCGYPDKKVGVVPFGERFGLGQELVPAELLDRFSSKVRDPMGRPEVIARTQAWHWRGRLKPYLKPIRERVRAVRASRSR